MAAAETAKKEGASVKVLGSGCAKCNSIITVKNKTLKSNSRGFFLGYCFVKH